MIIKMKLVHSLLLLVSWICLSSSQKLMSWQEYKVTFEKEFLNSEHETRHAQIFEETLDLIQSHNERYAKGLENYNLGINQFSDLPSEKLKSFSGYGLAWKSNTTELEEVLLEKYSGKDPLPSTVDWVKGGAVTSVKDEKNCHGHWAFSAIGAVEGAYFMYARKLKELSAQQIIDCDVLDKGCNGGAMINAYGYLTKNQAESEFHYPYRARDNRCTYDPRLGEIPFVRRYMRPPQDLFTIMQVLAQYGPHSIGINSSPQSFIRYRSGVYDDPQCDPYHLNRGALLVGYGTVFGKDYWLVKNSWGRSWGDWGYIKILRSHLNLCGVINDVTLPSFT